MNKKNTKRNLINEEIKNHQVKIVDENILLNRENAIKIAKEREKDLVLLSESNDGIGLCKIMDYQKFLYDKKKNVKKPDKIETKEIRFTPNIGEHDFNFKLKHAINFLEKGDRVKAFIFFKGREMAHQALGAAILSKFLEALKDYGVVDAPMKMEGNKMILFFRPKKK